MSELLTQGHLREFFHYDPHTGVFKRTKRRSWKGNVYECDYTPTAKTTYGYLQVNLGDGVPQFVHRLIFLYMTGLLPNGDVDHINGDRTDNRWCNLREVDRQSNLRNVGIKTNNTSGCPGVSYAKDRGKWHAYVHPGANLPRLNIGYFDSFEEAVTARKVIEKWFGFHENHGKRQSWRG